MGRVILRGVVKRHIGFIYYIDASGNLCIDACSPEEHLNKKYARKYIKDLTEETYSKKELESFKK